MTCFARARNIQAQTLASALSGALLGENFRKMNLTKGHPKGRVKIVNFSPINARERSEFEPLEKNKARQREAENEQDVLSWLVRA